MRMRSLLGACTTSPATKSNRGWKLRAALCTSAQNSCLAPARPGPRIRQLGWAQAFWVQPAWLGMADMWTQVASRSVYTSCSIPTNKVLKF